MLILLSAAGYFGNILRFEAFYNIDFLFGSIAAMYAIKRYGKPGIIVAFIASLYTYTIWNHPYAIIIFTAEAAFVAFARRHDEDIIILDLIYWLTLGAAMALVFYHYVMHIPGKATEIVLLKQSVNGVANTLCGSLIYHGQNYCRKLLGMSFKRVSFRQTFFKILILIAAIPALLYVIIGVRIQTENLTKEMKNSLNTIYNTTSIALDTLTEDAENKLTLLAEIAETSSGKRIDDAMQNILTSSETFMGIGYLDSKARSVAIYVKNGKDIVLYPPADFSGRKIYTEARDPDKAYVSGLIPSRLQDRQKNLILLVKHLKENGGFVQGSMDFKTVETVMQSVSRDSGVILTLTDRNDNIIISTAPENVSGKKFSLPPSYDAYDYDKRGIFLLTPCPAKNVPIITKWRNAFYIKKGTLGSSGLSLTAQLPLSEHIGKINNIGLNALKVIYIVMILCILAALLISRQVSFHLERLRKYSNELPFMIQSGKSPIAVNSVFSEVTELSENFSNMAAMLSAKFAQLARQKSELTLILDSIPLIIFMKDVNNNILTGNREAAVRTGMPENMLINKNVKDLFPDLAWEVYENDAKVITSKKPLLGVIQNYKLRDTTIIVKTDKIPILDEEGEVASILVISQDITEELKAHAEKQRMLETLYQQAKMAEMGAMTAAIAHQWKQPLNTIALITQLMQSDIEDGQITKESIRSSTDMIMKNVEFMANTAFDFTEFFKTAKEKQMFRACETISDIYALIEPQFRKHNISVVVHQHEHFLIYGLKNEFKQVCLNILNNAKDALIERGQEEKRIDVYYENDENFRKIVVEDNAGGISSDLLPDKLFSIFQSTKGEKGTGLGLYICKSIIEEHMGGKITAENTDHGAKFTIFLPIDQTITKER